MVSSLCFCIPIMDRIEDLQATLPSNLKENRMDRDRVHFMIIDFESKEKEVVNYLEKNFQTELTEGYLRYYSKPRMKVWHMSKAKNAFRPYLTEDVYVSLDADCFTGKQGGMRILEVFETFGDRCVFHQFTGWLNNSCGRIACSREFYVRHGYNEDMYPRNFDDLAFLLTLLIREQCCMVTYQGVRNVFASRFYTSMVHQFTIRTVPLFSFPMLANAKHYPPSPIYKFYNEFNRALTLCRLLHGKAFLPHAQKLLDLLPTAQELGLEDKRPLVHSLLSQKHHVVLLTTYFNFSGNPYYHQNFVHFATRIRNQGGILYTMELLHPGQSSEVDPHLCDRYFSIVSSTSLWVKENLLNLLLDKLPDECAIVGWIDHDILFEKDDWIQELREEMRTHHVVQLFREVVRCGPHPIEDYLSDPIRVEKLPMGWGEDNRMFSETFRFLHPEIVQKLPVTPGYAWAMRRDLLVSLRFYDQCILGGADRVFCDGLFFVQPSPRPHDYYYLSSFRANTRRYLDRFPPNLSIGSLSTRIYHQYHGSYANRQYHLRHQILSEIGFDPQQHLHLLPDGLYQLTLPPVSNQRLQNWLREYYKTRDGTIK